MNRQTKRQLQRQGQLGPDGTPAARRPPNTAGQRRPPEPNRPGAGKRFAQYLREVKGELQKVLWPNRSEVVNYSTVVLTTLLFLAALIFFLNYAFAKGVFFLFKT